MRRAARDADRLGPARRRGRRGGGGVRTAARAPPPTTAGVERAAADPALDVAPVARACRRFSSAVALRIGTPDGRLPSTCVQADTLPVRLVDLSAPITQSPTEMPEVLRTDIEFARPRRGRRADRGAARACPRGCCATARAGRPRRSPASARTTRPTSTRPGTTTRASAASRPRRSTSSRSSGSSAAGVVLDMTAKGDGERDRRARTSRRSWSGSGTSSASATSSSCAPGATLTSSEPGYMALGPGGDGRGHAVAVRARRARDGHRRLGLGRAAPPAGPGGARARRAGRLLGRPPGRHARTRRSSGW